MMMKMVLLYCYQNKKLSALIWLSYHASLYVCPVTPGPILAKTFLFDFILNWTLLWLLKSSKAALEKQSTQQHCTKLSPSSIRQEDQNCSPMLRRGPFRYGTYYLSDAEHLFQCHHKLSDKVIVDPFQFCQCNFLIIFQNWTSLYSTTGPAHQEDNTTCGKFTPFALGSSTAAAADSQAVVGLCARVREPEGLEGGGDPLVAQGGQGGAGHPPRSQPLCFFSCLGCRVFYTFISAF